MFFRPSPTFVSMDLNKILQRQIKKTLGRNAEIPEEFQPLLEAVSETYTHYETDRERLERSMSISASELEEANHSLNRKTAEVQRILTNLKQGVLTCDLDFILNKEHSKFAEQIFEKDGFEGTSLFEVLQLSEEEKLSFERLLSFVSSPKKLKRWDKYIPLAPSEKIILVDGKEKYLDIEYQPIIQNEKLKNILVLIDDITQLKIIEKEKNKERSAHQKQTNTIYTLAQSEQLELIQFFDSTKQDLENLRKANNENIEQHFMDFFRFVHTLKGNAATLDFQYFAEQLHKFEDWLSQVVKDGFHNFKQETWGEFLGHVSSEFDFILELFAKIFPQHQAPGVFVKQEEIKELKTALAKSDIPEKDQIFSRIDSWDADNLVRQTAKYNKLIERLKEKFDKDIGDLILVEPEFSVSKSSFHRFDNCLIHLIRNAVDHGIENREERARNQKGSGKIELNVQIKNGMIEVSLSDDGRGIDSDLLIRNAIREGLLPEEKVKALDENDKLNLIYLDGLSSSDQVTDISGRGVGMSAVKAEIESLGGMIEVQSKKGQGTTFTLALPEV